MMNLFFLMEHSDSWASHETHCEKLHGTIGRGIESRGFV